MALAALVLGLPAGARAAQEQRGDGGSNRGHVLVGIVRDAQSGEPIAGATVSAAGPWGTVRAVTDDLGGYRLVLPATAPVAITVERIGYAPVRVTLTGVSPGLPLDFGLRPRPLVLLPLAVRTAASSPALAELLEPGLTTRSEASPARDLLAWGREANLPLRSLLQTVGGRTGDGGPGETPSPPPGGASALAVRGSTSRRTVTFVSNAPAALPGPVSFAADPFGSSLRLRTWDGGAPARVTGGLETVLEGTEDRQEAGPGLTWGAGVDVLRSTVVAAWRADRIGVDVRATSTLPSTRRLLGESGHSSRAVSARVGLAPGAGQRVEMALSLQSESLPLADGGPPPGDPPGVDVGESRISLLWQGSVWGGVVTARWGSAWSTAFVRPSPGSGTGAGPGLRDHRSIVSAEVARPLGRSAAVAVGIDRLANRWSTSGDLEASTWGAYADVVYRGLPSLLVRGGARIDRSVDGRAFLGAPRLRAEAQVGSRVRLGLGSGVHHQALYRPADALGPVRAVLARGLHHVGSARIRTGPIGIGLDLWTKRLSWLPQHDAPVRVLGAGVGILIPLPGEGSVDVGTVFERRPGPGAETWTRSVAAVVERGLPWNLRLNARLEASRIPGGLLLPGSPADTLSPGTVLQVDPGEQAWSVGLDMELSFHVPLGAPDRADLRVYAQVLNALGEERRAFHLVGAETVEGGAGARLPRALVFGIRVGGGPEP